MQTSVNKTEELPRKYMTEQPTRQPELSTEEIERITQRLWDRVSGDGTPPISFDTAPAETQRDIEADMTSGRLRRLPVFECGAQVGILQLQFLQACERMKIAREKWPDFTIPATSTAPVTIQPRALVVELPAFDVRHDSQKEWLSRVDRLCKKQARQIAKECQDSIRAAERKGILIPLKRSRVRSSSQARRMEWASLHHCEKLSFGRIQQLNKYNPEGCGLHQIKNAVRRILRELGVQNAANHSRK